MYLENSASPHLAASWMISGLKSVSRDIATEIRCLFHVREATSASNISALHVRL